MKVSVLLFLFNWLLAFQTRRSKVPQSEAGKGIIALLVILLLLGFCALVIGLSWKVHLSRRDDRAKIMQGVAQQLGFSYLAKALFPPILNSLPLPFRDLASPELENVMHGSSNGLNVSIFDYRHNKRYPNSNRLQSNVGRPFVDTMILIQSATRPAGFYNYGNTAPAMVRQRLDEALRAYNQQQ